MYSAPNLVLNGIGKAVYEVLLYNFDMLDLDFERAAQDQLATFKFRKGGIPCSGGQWDYTVADYPQCRGNILGFWIICEDIFVDDLNLYFYKNQALTNPLQECI